LALIYEAKGIDQETANRMADRIMGQGGAALDTLAREELGIDPDELGGSAWVASIMSFILFAIGAIIPVIPFIFGGGFVAVLFSLVLGILGLFIVGVGITLTTGASLLKSAGRQVLLGLAAAAITFGLGLLIGSRLG
ncbi:MAG TPA: VIT1/CCC1 transporter family protein, partial [Ktedonobacteraceae bacterium]